jgi:cytochrome c oxidase subunit I
MTTVAPKPMVTRPWPVRPAVRGSALGRLLRTTDAKQIGLMYLATAFGWFLVGGLMAMLMRAELARPGLQFLSVEQYNQLFTMHGTIMLLFFATPIVFAFANYIVPLQIGAPDVSFPRLNALAYWLYLFGSTLAMGGLVTSAGLPSFGWTAYVPLSEATHMPGTGADMWIVGLVLSGLGTILGAVNMITTILTLRAPGLTMFRMSLFTWNILATGVLVLVAFPLLTAALLALEADRRLGAHVYDSETGGPILWQHLFWFFGHPEVYIVALPFFGIVSEIVPVFSRKPIFGYKGLVGATIAIAAYSLAVWAHHMYATGRVLLPFFSFLTFLIAVPTGVKFFNWIGTMWRGQLTFETPMLFALGFMTTFLIGGLSGVLLASPPIDFHTHDSYFVVAHFHYVLFGTIVFAVFAGVYFWFPKMFGRMMDERLGKVHFWLTVIGFHTTFLIQHWLGNRGMPRRYADYRQFDGFTTWHMISSVGAFILGASILPFLWNVYKSYRMGRVVEADDPWGHGMSLEWATSCPPPLRNFDRMPRIRSERPAFDLHHPEHAPGHSLKNPPPGGAKPLTHESDGGGTYLEAPAPRRSAEPGRGRPRGPVTGRPSSRSSS